MGKNVAYLLRLPHVNTPVHALHHHLGATTVDLAIDPILNRDSVHPRLIGARGLWLFFVDGNIEIAENVAPV